MREECVWPVGDGRLAVRRGDLTRAESAAIVNAANSSLLGGGGVDGAIHRAAGPRLLAACKAIAAERGPLPPGRAVITPGFDLPARFVIHTVGPIWQGGGCGEPDVLASAYDESLRLAAENGLSDISFPAISCGVYGYPVALAAPLAIGRLTAALAAGLVAEAAMVLFSTEAFQTWAGCARDALGNPSDHP
ncbi:Appr-1-p processing domain protein [Desulfovibrio sp. X2]|uniref:macro domain-containing protein n=1 Tax=Desulfovibrio sp. X2 TaxID=941449 RepID=UPI000358C0E7|nr:macro domain-containing protein [Desulfovibrio sp. X2]EPR42470.1 Appr-1-p processing domain protein [Desulfovibrio sp. X2]